MEQGLERRGRIAQKKPPRGEVGAGKTQTAEEAVRASDNTARLAVSRSLAAGIFQSKKEI